MQCEKSLRMADQVLRQATAADHLALIDGLQATATALSVTAFSFET
jgi:hypothetical protein